MLESSDASTDINGIIQVLPDTLANKIAAGEVVQRPSSVVKELLENAVDAAASQVTVVIKKAGSELIQVVDDGCGMSPEDARTCFQRHATSKISTAEDLDRIHTLGFRGEALASIAAVAQVELRTKRLSDSAGTAVRIEGGVRRTVEPCATPSGTALSVRNLFFNVPARRNFLKSAATEFKHVVETVQFIALSNPEIGFTLLHDGREVFNLASETRASDPLERLQQRIAGVLGHRQLDSLVPVREHTSYLSIEGFVGKPEFSRKTRGEQFFFINGRYVKHRSLEHAVASAYGEILPKGAFPFFVLFLRLDPSHVDVNVHPTKAEVKFDDERGIYAFVRRAVKEALGGIDITPSVGFSDTGRLVERSYTNKPGAASPRSSQAPGSNEPERTSRGDGDRTERPRPAPVEHQSDFFRRPTAPSIEALYGGNEGEAEPMAAPGRSSPATPGEEGSPGTEAVAPFMWQLSEKYVLAQIAAGLMIMDQHAAHERILYEKFLGAMERGGSPSQQLLFPHTLEFQPADYELLTDLLPDLRALGFDIERFGGRSIVVRGVPVDIPAGLEKEALDDVLQQFKNYRDTFQLKGRDNLAKSLACRSAIKTGKRLTRSEMQTLVDQLMACDMPYACPHGRPTMIKMSIEELDKRFGRIGHLERA